MSGSTFTVEIVPQVPAALSRLSELAGDLYYSWDRFSRGLFFYLDRDLWQRCHHNPKVFLRQISQQRLEQAAGDRTFLENYHRALANYDTYLAAEPAADTYPTLPEGSGPVAYFCAEFGLHESLPIYSGGLGILAGDLCKAASDRSLSFVAIGLLYRHGNFVQTIDETGGQTMLNAIVENDDLPIQPVLDEHDQELVINVPMMDSDVSVKLWRVKAGHIDILLLDTDCPVNDPEDREITDHLYPADGAQRLRQEIILGVGGAMALERLGIEPSVWHINEGHPALALLGRYRSMTARGIPLAAAVELVAATTVFTTHTPVPAGHEVFDHNMLTRHLGKYLDELGFPRDRFLELGAVDDHDHFSLTAFALRCSGYRNGVSRIHGNVAARMEAHIWPQITAVENPIGYITNGVHVPTFLAREWIATFGDTAWRSELTNAAFWQQRIAGIPDEAFWRIRRLLKTELIAEIRRRLLARGHRLGYSEAQIESEMRCLDPAKDVLLMGFARRFAGYKRATLLFEDPERMARLLNDPARPVVLIFAGRAHQSDEDGQALIRQIHAITEQPEFKGRVLLLEGYDLALARKLVAGVDIWLNSPEYPLEASGTSGMKAAINGAVNISVADGWWAEGFDGVNGWSVQPHPHQSVASNRRFIESAEMLDIIEHKAIPCYFDKSEGYSEDWVKISKASMMTVIPGFNAQRMLSDYLENTYLPSYALGRRLAADKAGLAVELAAWRNKVRECWPEVDIALVAAAATRLPQGAPMKLGIEVTLGGLSAGDVIVECVFDAPGEADDERPEHVYRLQPGDVAGGRTTYTMAIEPALSGLISYRLRAYPWHPMLPHRFDMGLMRWL